MQGPQQTRRIQHEKKYLKLNLRFCVKKKENSSVLSPVFDVVLEDVPPVPFPGDGGRRVSLRRGARDLHGGAGHAWF